MQSFSLCILFYLPFRLPVQIFDSFLREYPGENHWQLFQTKLVFLITFIFCLAKAGEKPDIPITLGMGMPTRTAFGGLLVVWVPHPHMMCKPTYLRVNELCLVVGMLPQLF